MKTTEWFPATVNPVHIGYYEVRYSWEDGRDPRPTRYWWDGEAWRFCKDATGELTWGSREYENISDEYWRGQTEQS
jgi:hypothetical protein